MKQRHRGAVWALAALALVAAACGGDDSESPAGAEVQEGGDTNATGAAANDGAGTATDGSAGGTSEDVEVDPNASVVLGASVPARNFDPHTSASIVGDYTHISMVYDRLIEALPGPELGPMVAKSWEFGKDGKVLVLQLDLKATFQDGSPIDADAVKASLDRAINFPESTVAAYLEMVDTIDVVDPQTVRINTNRPAGDLPSTLSTIVGSVINPKALDDPDLATQPAGSGAYTLKSYTGDDRAVFERVPDYWNPMTAGRAATITIVSITDDNAKLNAFQSGQLDGTFFKMAAYEDFAALAESDDNVNIFLYPHTATYQLFLNTDRSEIGDPLVRQALNYAVDREAINDELLAGQCPPTTQMLQSVYDGHVPALDDAYTYDPEKAKELLAEADVPDGFSFEIGVGAGLTPQTVLAPVLQAQFGEIGVDVSIREGDLLDINTTWAQGELDSYMQTRLGAPDPGVVLRDNYLQPTRFPGTPSDELKQAINATLDPTLDDAERKRLLEKANTMVTEQALDVFICSTPTAVAYTDEVVGMEAMGQSDFQGVYDPRYVTKRAS